MHSNPQVVNERRNVDSNGRVRANGHGTATEHRLAAQQVAQLGLDLPPPGGRELAGGASRGRDLDGLYTARTMSGEGRARVAIPTGLAARAANGDPVEDETVGATEYEISDEQRAAMEVALNGNGNGSGEASGSGSGSADDSASTHSTGSQETERGGPVEAVDGPAVGPTLGEAGSEDFKVELKRLFEIENIVKEFASSEEWITAVEGLVSDELKALEWDGRSGSVNGESDSGSSGEVIQEDRVSVESVRLVETTE